jgi:hypothetical protein
MVVTRNFKYVVAIATMLASFISMMTSFSPPSGAVSVPACQASTIAVTIGPTVRGPFTYAPTAVLVTPVYFTNHGSTCHILLGGPVARAVRGISKGKLTARAQQSFPIGIPASDGKFVLDRGSQKKILFEVTKIEGSASAKRKCQPATASGFVIEGYAKPISSERVFARTLPGVCFDNHVGAVTVNAGLVWSSTG